MGRICKSRYGRTREKSGASDVSCLLLALVYFPTLKDGTSTVFRNVEFTSDYTTSSYKTVCFIVAALRASNPKYIWINKPVRLISRVLFMWIGSEARNNCFVRIGSLLWFEWVNKKRTNSIYFICTRHKKRFAAEVIYRFICISRW
jgi:hypothetical protein